MVERLANFMVTLSGNSTGINQNDIGRAVADCKTSLLQLPQHCLRFILIHFAAECDSGNLHFDSSFRMQRNCICLCVLTGLENFVELLYHSSIHRMRKVANMRDKENNVFLEGTVMYTTKIMLSSIDDVRNFVNFANQCDYDINLTNEKYKIDAKSIMGVFSLDLSKPVTVEIDADHADTFMEKLKAFQPASEENK
jgi:phosphotransferase system HPr-like phosphotransfer protein